MKQGNTETLRRIHALVAWLMQDETIPSHIADHLTDALLELGPMVHPPHVPAPRSDISGHSAAALAGIQAESCVQQSGVRVPVSVSLRK